MLDPDFARSGFAHRIADPARLTRFQVLGERSSGTNFVKRLLGRNTGLRATEALGWKHGFPHARAIPADLLVIGVVRRADAWARSMHAKPWHATPGLQALGFSDFIRAEWDTIIDRPRYFEGSKAAGEVGQPLMHDRHPLTGARFGNLFTLRQTKLQGLLSYAQRECAFVLWRMEDVIAAPEDALDRLSGALGRDLRTGPFRPVVKRLGSKFKPAIDARPETPAAMSPSDLAWLVSQCNAEQEARLGYSYG